MFRIQPEFRFSGFKDDWLPKKLKDITDVRDGTHESPKPQKQGFLLVTSKNLKGDHLDFKDSYYISKDDYKKINERSKVEIGDILFGMIGTVGNPILLRTDGFAIKNVALLKTNNLPEKHFILSYLKTNSIDKQFHKMNSGGTQKFIALGAIRNLEVKTPSSSDEQQKIGDFFSKLDRQIELEEQKLEKLEEQKKGYMQQIFSQQLRFKDENGDYYSEWKEKLIKDVLEFENNRRKPVTSTIREIGNYPYYGASGIIDYVKDYIFDNEKRLLIGEDGAKWGAFEESSFIATGKYWVNNHAHVTKSEFNNLNFLNYWLNYKELRIYVTGNAPAKLTYKNLCIIPILLPSKKEQNKIGHFFNKLDELIEKQSDKVELLKDRKKGFLQKMFV